MLKERIQEQLNGQIQKELQSAYIYFAMAGYFESIGLKGFANWMTVQTQEELSHAQRLCNYVNDRGGRTAMLPIEAPQNEWDSPLAAVQNVYEHECYISESIGECITLAIEENDHMTNSLLQWFVVEQIEEEASADELVQKLKLAGNDSSVLFMMDAELGSRVFTPPAGKAGA